MTPERRFRVNRVAPFLKTLKHTAVFPIQQLALRGTPDYLLCVRGFFVAMELKAPGKKPDPLQRATLERIERSGGMAFSVSELNWERIKEILLALDQGEDHAHTPFQPSQ